MALATTKDARNSRKQHREFAKAARELGCDDNADAFDRTLKKVAAAPPPTSVKKRKKTNELALPRLPPSGCAS